MKLNKHGVNARLALVAASAFIGFSAPAAQAAVALSAYNVAPNTVSISGISSGGYMAVQMQVAYSSKFQGAAIFAGGPYYCAQGNMFNATGYCMSGSGIPLSSLYSYTDSNASSGKIDPTSNLANHKVYMFSGTNDTAVKQPVMNALKSFYQHYNVSNIIYNNTSVAQHAWISDYGPNSCNSSSTPYINKCSDSPDPQKVFLQQIYGSLNAKNTGTLGGSYIQFDQTAFVASGKSMDTTGWAYVPTNCKNGQACKLHVVLHGCQQGQDTIQQKLVQKSGVNEWADTNNIVVLYPQAVKSSFSPLNPQGCWDWWGYNGSDYALKSGTQMKAIMAMINKITSGSSGTTTTTASGTTSTTTASTTTTTAAATCYTSSNYSHVSAGRAHQSLGITFANGSNQNMGLYNIFVTTTLKKTGTNYYVIGTCP
ncbi:MAG: PHA-depolymerase-like protein [Burkholderiales bacterium]|nr:PHA-depolymerase-like protein [Burkholderiales bacterium]